LSILGGVIDPGYTGELKVVAVNTNSGAKGYSSVFGSLSVVDTSIHLVKGQKLAQLVLIPFLASSDVEEGVVSRETERGAGGFGSTGQ